MKIQLSDTETITISLGEVASEVYAQGQYLKANFSAEDLQETGKRAC